MAIYLAQTYSAVAPNITSSFQASGGTPSYVYSVRPNGAGGTINSSTGVYTAPSQVGTSLQTLYDVVQVIDNVGAIAIAKILVGTPLMLLADIIQTQMGLASDHIFLWDLKLFLPTDSSLWVGISAPLIKPFGNNNLFDSFGNQNQVGNFLAVVDVDIVSRGSSARDQKELVLLAIMSDYSIRQQEANSFTIGRLPTGFKNLSEVDGAAILYRYTMSLQMQYAASISAPTLYYNQFFYPEIYTNA